MVALSGGKGAGKLPTTRRAPRSPDSGGRLYALLIGEDRFTAVALPDRGSVEVGRDPQLAIVIDDELASRRHARLTIDEGAVSISDLSSANGTKVGDRVLTSGETHPLPVGQLVAIGAARLLILRRQTPLRSLRLWRPDDFDRRLDEECARVAELGGRFAAARVDIDASAEPALILSALSAVIGAGDLAVRAGPTTFKLLIAEVTTESLAGGGAADAVASALGDAFAAASGAEARIAVVICPDDGSDPDAIERALSAGLVDDASASTAIVIEDSMVQLYELARRVAAGHISVLIIGESGSGKELVAEELVRASRRARRPLVRLNCGAITETLFESELFGHEKGAFTGADATKPGILEVVSGGTLLLDEIGELPLESQVTLLRVLESRTFRRVGGTEEIAVDVRFIAATNRDLEAECEVGAFRADLYFRIAGVTLVVPPLRQRPGDIEAMAEAFVARASGEREPPALSAGAREFLLAYSWPGNVRELRNVIERAVLLADGVIDVEHLPISKLEASVAAPAASLPALTAAEILERARIVSALAEHGGNQTSAARALGISRPTLSKRLDRYRIARPKKKHRD